MRKILQARCVILGIQGTQYKVTDNVQRHFENAVRTAVEEKDNHGIVANVLAEYDAYNQQRISPVKAFAKALGVSEHSLQKSIYSKLEMGVYGMAVKHVSHDSKLCRATKLLEENGIKFATLTKLNADFAQEFYRVNGVRDIHKRETIFAHEDVDFANKSTAEAYWPALNQLGYKQGDDLSSVLVVDENIDNLTCAKEMGMMTARISDQNRSMVNEGAVDFEYQNVKVLMHEIYDAIQKERAPKQWRPSWM